VPWLDYGRQWKSHTICIFQPTDFQIEKPPLLYKELSRTDEENAGLKKKNKP